MTKDHQAAADIPARDLLEMPWFQTVIGIDMRSLALFRVCFGVMLSVVFASALFNLTAFYTDAGVLPVAVAESLQLPGQWSLHNLSGSALWQGLLIVAGLLASVAYTIGLRPRLAGVVTLVLLLSLPVRNPLVLIGGDILMRCMLFWSLFLPLGARFSVDARRSSGDSPVPQLVVSRVSIAPVAQLAIMYFFTGVLKTGPEWHDEASAVAVGLASFGTPIGHWLGEAEWLMAWLTRATWWLEVVGPLLLLCPLFAGPIRTLVTLTFMAFHVGLAVTLELGHFPYVCLACWTIVFPSWFWERIARLSGRSSPDDEPSSAPKSWVPGAGKVGQGVVFAALVVVMVWNLGSLVRSRSHIPAPVEVATRAIGLDQSWRMFAPSPQRLFRWIVFSGRRADGTVVDAFHEGEPFTWDRPEDVATCYGAVPWRKFLYNVAENRYESTLEGSAVRSPLADYLCSRSAASAPLERVEITLMTPEKGGVTRSLLASRDSAGD